MGFLTESSMCQEAVAKYGRPGDNWYNAMFYTNMLTRKLPPLMPLNSLNFSL